MILQCALCSELITSNPIAGQGVPIVGQTDRELTEASARTLYPALALHVHTRHAEAVRDTMHACDRFVFLLLLTFCVQSPDRDKLGTAMGETVEQALIALKGPVASAADKLQREAEGA